MSEKERWEETARYIDKTVDWAGKGLDKEIKELITALNFLGIRTSGSCIGHLTYGDGPYINFSSAESDEYFNLIRPILLEATKKNKEVDFEDLIQKHKKIFEKGKAENYKITIKLFELLDEFYKEKKVSSGIRLVVDFLGQIKEPRIRNQGATFLNDLPRDEKGLKLKEYQKEFFAFSNFLKGKCLEGDRK